MDQDNSDECQEAMQQFSANGAIYTSLGWSDFTRSEKSRSPRSTAPTRTKALKARTKSFLRVPVIPRPRYSKRSDRSERQTTSPYLSMYARAPESSITFANPL